jgi:hypothetical protein
MVRLRDPRGDDYVYTSKSLRSVDCILPGTYPFLYRAFHNFPVITNIYNKKTKGPTLMEFFTATGKLRKFFVTTRHVQRVHHR